MSETVPYIYAGNYYYNMKKHRTSFVSFSTKIIPVNFWYPAFFAISKKNPQALDFPAAQLFKMFDRIFSFIAIALCSNQGIFAIRIKIILEKFQTFGKHFLHLHQDKR